MDVDIDALQQTYKQLNDLLGTELMLEFYAEFRGVQLNLPMKLYDRDGTIQAVQKNVNHLTVKELSDKYGYSRRWIQRIINGDLSQND